MQYALAHQANEARARGTPTATASPPVGTHDSTSSSDAATCRGASPPLPLLHSPRASHLGASRGEQQQQQQQQHHHLGEEGDGAGLRLLAARLSALGYHVVLRRAAAAAPGGGPISRSKDVGAYLRWVAKGNEGRLSAAESSQGGTG